MAEKNGVTLSLSVRQALALVFVLGLVAGALSMSALNSFGATSNTGTSDTLDKEVKPQPDQPSPSPQPSGQGGVSTDGISLEGEPVLGSDDAPVTLVYWGDFQCPFCKRYEQNTFPQIKQNYIQEGKVRLIFKNFAFLGPDSTAGAIASECVWNQVGQSNPNAYWSWQAMMFENQDGENSGWGSQSDIVSATKNLEGVNTDQLQSCMNEKESQLKKEIDEDKSQGRQAGISGTPGFVVYRTGSSTGQNIVGAQPYSAFRNKIDGLLNQ